MVENFREAAFQLSSLPADDPSSPTEIEIDAESSKLSLSVSITDAVLEQELRFEEEQTFSIAQRTKILSKAMDTSNEIMVGRVEQTSAPTIHFCVTECFQS